MQDLLSLSVESDSHILSMHLQTSSQYLHIYKVRFSGKKLIFGGKQLSGLSLASIALVHSEKTPFSDGNRVT